MRLILLILYTVLIYEFVSINYRNKVKYLEKENEQLTKEKEILTSENLVYISKNKEFAQKIMELEKVGEKNE